MKGIMLQAFLRFVEWWFLQGKVSRSVNFLDILLLNEAFSINDEDTKRLKMSYNDYFI